MNGNTHLGLSPGTRFIGIAILEDGVLKEFQMRSFQGRWSNDKLKSITNMAIALIQRYNVSQVSVKLPDVSPNSKAFNQLIGSINVLCERKNLPVHYYTLSEIKRFHCRDRKLNRKNLIEVIANTHPELTPEYRREKQNRNAYYFRLFEAVAVAKMR